jgi:hypothetical protein
MILINLSHPLTAEQQAVIEGLARQKITRLIEQFVHFDLDQPLAEQATALVDMLGLSPNEWQQATLVVNLPALNYGAAAVLAELHGRCGHFPAIVCFRPVKNSLPSRYEVAEIVNLQALRDNARMKRGA